jgi:hypothetical protein
MLELVQVLLEDVQLLNLLEFQLESRINRTVSLINGTQVALQVI